jgi:hypothetical protein
MGVYNITTCFYLSAVLLAIAFVPCLKIEETKKIGTLVVH